MESIAKIEKMNTVKNSEIIIEGLDCPDCAIGLTKTMEKVEGVNKVEVDFFSGKMSVEHTNELEEIIKQVKKTGYKTKVDQRQERIVGKKNCANLWINIGTITTILSGFFILLGAITTIYLGEKNLGNVFFVLAIIVGSYEISKRGIASLKVKNLDMNILMIIAIFGATLIGEFSEGALVVFLFSIGNSLQSFTMSKTKKSISSLIELAPNEAVLKTTNGSKRVSVETLKVDDTILIKPGTRIAIDGRVIDGHSMVNQAAITGESIPVEKNIGDEVYAGTINEHGFLEIQVTKVFKDTKLSNIIRLIQEAQSKKAPIQQTVDKFANYYTPFVVILAVLIATIPPVFFAQPFDIWFRKALILLVISCPCALVISTPVAIVSAIGNASKEGILVKGGVYIEEIGRVDVIALDKTGTLTKGNPVITDIQIIDDSDCPDPLRIAGVLENSSEHPIAKAIIAKANQKGYSLNFKVKNFKAIIGKGVEGAIESTHYYLGNMRLFEEIGVNIDKIRDINSDNRKRSISKIILGTKEKIIAVFTLSDDLRSDSKETIRALNGMNIDKVIMLTGDNEGTAKSIATKLGLEDFRSDLLPEDKLTIVDEYIDRGKRVAMVGDGINDGPALAKANVGIAMGAIGTDSALETADIVLMGDELMKIPYIIDLSKKTISIIKQNIVFAISLKAIFMALAVLGLANMWMAIVADTGAAIIVILNGMRLLKNSTNKNSQLGH
ncbi:MAG: heavy metal translocating P-type ATPase [Alkaliphilus sp.]|nr:MAG: heavy metal translocating P-type ATPase [Alkaliphilus sp.]